MTSVPCHGRCFRRWNQRPHIRHLEASSSWATSAVVQHWEGWIPSELVGNTRYASMKTYSVANSDIIREMLTCLGMTLWSHTIMELKLPLQLLVVYLLDIYMVDSCISKLATIKIQNYLENICLTLKTHIHKKINIINIITANNAEIGSLKLKSIISE